MYYFYDNGKTIIKQEITFYKDEIGISSNFDKQIQNFCLKAKKLGEYIKTH